MRNLKLSHQFNLSFRAFLRPKYTLVAVLCLLPGGSAFGQSPADGPWSGSIQCDLNIQQTNYERQETQTWTLTGKKLEPNGSMRIYEAEWTATGHGRYLRSQGSVPGGQILTQWTVNVPTTVAPLSFYMAPNGQSGIVIKQWHSQLRADHAMTGTYELPNNGVQETHGISGTVFEWAFGMVSGGLLNPTISGTKTIESIGLGAGTYPITGQAQQPSAVCRWNFTKGPVPSNTGNSSSNCAQSASITQAFDAMKADIEKEFESLIQQTQDPAVAAKLKEQERNSLNQLESLKQQNLMASSAACSANSTANTGQTSPPTNNSSTNGSSSNNGRGSTNAANTGQNPPPGNTGNSSNSNSSNTGQSNGSTTGSQANGTGSQRAPAPQLLTVAPGSIEQGATNVQMTLTGRATNWQKNMTQLDLGSGITVTAGPFFTQTTEAVVIVTVADNTTPGARPVTVTTNTERVGLPLNLPSPPLKTGRPVTNQPLKLGAATPAQPATGNYLITIIGLRCVTSTGEDDVLKGDGKGDEIYASAYVRRYDRRTFEELEQTNLRTMVYGDISRYPDRIRAGSGSGTGGIASGDTVPDNARLERIPSVPASDSIFPFKLYSGPLTDGADALVISPSIWEYDEGSNAYYLAWSQHQEALNRSIFYDQLVQSQLGRKNIVPLTLGGNVPPPDQGPVHDIRQDRPIGFITTGFQAVALPDTALVLTREMVEQSLYVADPHQAIIDKLDETKGWGAPSTMPPGIIVLNFQDSGGRQVSYVMYIQVERM